MVLPSGYVNIAIEKHVKNKYMCYPLVIEHGSGKSPRTLGMDVLYRKFTDEWSSFQCHVGLITGG